MKQSLPIERRIREILGKLSTTVIFARHENNMQPCFIERCKIYILSTVAHKGINPLIAEMDTNVCDSF